MMKAVCLLSGGMDSATAAYLAKEMGYSILALHTTYGQRTAGREERCAEKIASLLGAEEFIKVNLGYLSVFGGSSLTDPSIGIDSQKIHQGLPDTYVPFRNANLLAVATSFAETRRADAIFIGVQASDYAGYPDCRPEFIQAFRQVIETGTAEDTHIELMAPFVLMNKRQIIAKGLELGVPYEHTWSCYRNEDVACGLCTSCQYRLEAFREAGVPDPIDYVQV